jgi:hypothetical protein
VKKASILKSTLAGSALLATGATLAAPPPTIDERQLPVQVTIRYPDGTTDSPYLSCIVFNAGDTPGAMYFDGHSMVWNYGKLGLDKTRFEGVGADLGGVMIYGKFPETKTSGEAPGTPKIEGTSADGTTFIVTPLKGSFCI